MSYAKYYEDNLDYVTEDRGLTLGPFHDFASLLADAQRSKQVEAAFIRPTCRYRCPLCQNAAYAKKHDYYNHIDEVHHDSFVRCFINGMSYFGRYASAIPPRQVIIRNFSNKEAHAVLKDYGIQDPIQIDIKPDSSVDLLEIISQRNNSDICPHFKVEFSSAVQGLEYTLQAASLINYPQPLAMHYIKSDQYDELISEGKANRDELAAIMLMAISDGNDEYIDQLADYLLTAYPCIAPREETIISAILCYVLRTGITALEKVKSSLSTAYYSLCSSIYYALQGDQETAEEFSNHFTHVTKSNDFGSSLYIISLLTHNTECIQSYRDSDSSNPILAILQRFIEPALSDCSISFSHNLKTSIQVMSLFENIPMVAALIEAYGAIEKKTVYSEKAAILLNNISPACMYYYCLYTQNSSVAEKRWKNALKKFPHSVLISSHYNDKQQTEKKHLLPSDGQKYVEYVKNYISNHQIPLAKALVDWSIEGDDFYVTPISGGSRAGESCFILSIANRNIMIDCGGQQHSSEVFAKLDNWEGRIDAIIISHAHTDHSGALPKVHAMWPLAPIYSSYQTKAYLSAFLSDVSSSDSIDEWAELSVQHENAENTYQSIIPLLDNKWQALSDQISFRFHKAGHIPGSMMIEIKTNKRTILYSGDFSSFDQATARGCDVHSLPKLPDMLICESTLMDDSDSTEFDSWEKQRENLAAAIEQEILSRHCIILPVSALGKCQEILCLVAEMRLDGRIPESIPLYIGGLAEKASYAISDYMTPQYERNLRMFRSFKEVSKSKYPPIIIASGAQMTPNSLSRKAFQWCKQQFGKYAVTVISTTHSIESTEQRAEVINCSLDNHARMNELIELLELKPKTVSFVHWSTDDNIAKKKAIASACCGSPYDPIVIDLSTTHKIQINDILNYAGEEKL